MEGILLKLLKKLRGFCLKSTENRYGVLVFLTIDTNVIRLVLIRDCFSKTTGVWCFFKSIQLSTGLLKTILIRVAGLIITSISLFISVIISFIKII